MRATRGAAALLVALNLLILAACNDFLLAGVKEIAITNQDSSSLQIGFSGTDTASSVTGNLTLPTTGSNGSTITWASDNPSIISVSGVVTRPTTSTVVTLTATISKGRAKKPKPYALTVPGTAPAITSAVPGNRKVTITWPAVIGATSYNLYWAAGMTVSTASGTKVSNAISPQTIGGLTNGTQYAFIVTAVSSNGESAPSPVATATPIGSANPTTLYVANYGSNNVSAYLINADGSLTPVAGSPFALGSSYSYPRALTVDPSNKYLYVANSGNDNVSAFTINSDGSLTQIFGSPIVAGWAPYSIAVTPSSTFAFVPNASGGNPASISAYRINTSGLLVQVSGSPFPTAPDKDPWSAVVDPTGKYLYVANWNGIPTLGTASAFAINADGSLTTVPGSPFTAGLESSSIAITPSGMFVYVSNDADGNITAFSTNANGSLTELTSLGSPFSTGGFYDHVVCVAIDPLGKFLYTTADWEKVVVVFKINADGSLTLVGRFSTGTATPVSVAVDPSGKYAYVTYYDQNKVAAFAINSDGSLTPLAVPSYVTGTNPQAVTTTH